jgi:lysozyme family protein
VFDYGVNSGIGRAAKVLRRLVGLASNSSAMTDEVMAAVGRCDPKNLINAICDERLRFLHGLRTWSVFGNGWGRRVREVRAAALAMAAKAPGKPRPASKPAPGVAAKGRNPSVPAAKKLGWGAAFVALVAAGAHWIAENPLTTIGAFAAAALVAFFVVRSLKSGG